MSLPRKTITLPWRDRILPIGDTHIAGPAISTSITDNEAERLREISAHKVVVEIGSAYGFSAILMAVENGLRGAKHVLAVDPHEGYGSLPASYVKMRQNVAAYGVERKVSILRMRSSEMWPVLVSLNAHPDVVFVDGDHRLEAVREDIDRGWSVLPSGGILAVHDVGEETCPAVAPAVHAFLREQTLGGVRLETLLVDTLWSAVKP